MSMRKPYDSTIARIAGNILSGYDLSQHSETDGKRVYQAVKLARMIVEEVKRTEPKESAQV